MTISPEIKQLNRQDFVEYLYQLQEFAKNKYSFDIFLENRLTNQDGFTNTRIWKSKGKIDLNDNVNTSSIRDEIYDDEFYNHIM